MKSLIAAAIAATVVTSQAVFDDDLEERGRELERADNRELGHKWGRGRSRSPSPWKPVKCSRRECCILAEASAIITDDPTDTTMDVSGWATYSQYGGRKGCDCGGKMCKGTCIRANVWGLTGGDKAFHIHDYGIGKYALITLRS